MTRSQRLCESQPRLKMQDEDTQIEKQEVDPDAWIENTGLQPAEDDEVVQVIFRCAPNICQLGLAGRYIWTLKPPETDEDIIKWRKAYKEA